MSEASNSGQVHDEHKKEQRDEQHRSAQFSNAGASGMPLQDYNRDLPSLPLSDPHLNGRGNQPVRIARMLQMQRVYGNRAVQRSLHGGTCSGQSIYHKSAQRSSIPGVRLTQGTIAIQRQPGPQTADHLFDRYRELFNSLWGTPPFFSLPVAYDPSLSSRGPRTPRSREIFSAIMNQHQDLRSAYNANTGGVRERIDLYIRPEGFNLIGSGRLDALRRVLDGFPTPVSAAQYGQFRDAVRAGAAGLADYERSEINNSNDWQRLINSKVVQDDQRIEIRSIISPTPSISPTPQPANTNGVVSPQEQMRQFIAGMDFEVWYYDGSSSVPFNSNAWVWYFGGAQNFIVQTYSERPNPGAALSVRAQVLRGTNQVAVASGVPFPANAGQTRPIPLTVRAPNRVPSRGDVLTVRVELLDRASAVLRTRSVSIPVHPEVTYTQQQAERSAREDEAFFHDTGNSGLLGIMRSRGGITANVAEAIVARRITLQPTTVRHDSADYVQRTLGHPDTSQVAYFVGTSYGPYPDANSYVRSAGSDGRSLSLGNIVVNRTMDVLANSKRATDDIIRLVVHESVHALDINPTVSASNSLELYKREFRAYWMDGRFGPPDVGTCPQSAGTGGASGASGASGICLDTAYDFTLPPPGPKSQRARAIFNQLYGSPTYPFVQPAYDNNTDGFREAVDGYLIPDGINLVVSMRLEDLRAAIERYRDSPSNYPQLLFLVRSDMGIGPVPPGGRALSPQERNEISGNRAWRHLIERKVPDRAHQDEIKRVLGIPRAYR